jgi:hypothetical protein
MSTLLRRICTSVGASCPITPFRVSYRMSRNQTKSYTPMKTLLTLTFALAALPFATTAAPAKATAACCSCCEGSCCAEGTCSGDCCDGTCCAAACCTK